MSWVLHLSCRSPGALAAFVGLLTVAGLATLAPVLYPEGPWDIIARPFLKPFEHEAHPLGTDMLGRDVLAGVLYGARVSIVIGLASTGIACLIGILLGSVAGYYAGVVDDALMRGTEIFQTLPSLIIAIVIVALFQPSSLSIMTAIAIVTWPPVARVVRAEFLSMRQREFVQAAILTGQSDVRIIFVQILPNAMSPVIVMAAFMIGMAILMESGLSFLGLGDPNQISWGFMVGAARAHLRDGWWMSVFPGTAILLTVLSIVILAEWLRRALDPQVDLERRS